MQHLNPIAYNQYIPLLSPHHEPLGPRPPDSRCHLGHMPPFPDLPLPQRHVRSWTSILSWGLERGMHSFRASNSHLFCFIWTPSMADHGRSWQIIADFFHMNCWVSLLRDSFLPWYLLGGWFLSYFFGKRPRTFQAWCCHWGGTNPITRDHQRPLEYTIAQRLVQHQLAISQPLPLPNGWN